MINGEEDKKTADQSGASFSFENNAAEGSNVAIAQGQNVSQENTFTGGGDPWKPVEDYIESEIPAESQEQVSQAVAFIKSEVEAGNNPADSDEWSSVKEIIGDIQPLVKLVSAAAPSIATFFGAG